MRSRIEKTLDRVQAPLAELRHTDFYTWSHKNERLPIEPFSFKYLPEMQGASAIDVLEWCLSFEFLLKDCKNPSDSVALS